MDIVIGISLTIVIAAVIAGIFQKLKQPIIIGHIVTGILVGPYFFHNISFTETMDSLSQIGIALLLFIIGLSLSPKVIKEMGRVSLVAGLGQIIATVVPGFFLARYLGFPVSVALYFALALTFSSTIIIMKLLSDKKDLAKPYSKISMGMLLVQDVVVAIILLCFAALSSGNSFSWQIVGLTFLRGFILIDVLLLIALYVVPTLSSSFAKSQEFLFLFSIGWGLGVGVLFHILGFSIEIGALIAGIMLSISPYHLEISSRLKPLRDFFVILFFILIGSRLSFGTLSQVIYPVAILSLFVIVLKPVIVSLIIGLMGYRKRISFQTGVNFTQISEFSLILLLMGQKAGQINNDYITIITLVMLITIFISSYSVLYSEKIYPFFSRLVFERKQPKVVVTKQVDYDVILFGCNRVGFDIADHFNGGEDKLLVVDYDPAIISQLTEQKISCLYGDAEDNEFLDELNLSKVKMIISTIPDFEGSEFLIGKVRSVNKDAIIIVISHEIDEAIALYQDGATYVITPHFLGGQYASMLISKFGFDIDKFLAEKEKHLSNLKDHREAQAIS